MLRKYPDEIYCEVRSIKENAGESAPTDEEIDSMEEKSVFDCILSGHGMPGFGTIIRTVVLDVFGVELDPENDRETWNHDDTPYSPRVMESVRMDLGASDPADRSFDQEISDLDGQEVFDRFVRHAGLSFSGEQIRQLISNIHGVSLE